jgi:hypothetical protein
LDKPGNNFEKGSRDLFEITCPELGEIQKIRIGHDNKGVNSAWYLERATVCHKQTGRKWFFYSNSWYEFLVSQCTPTHSILGFLKQMVTNRPLETYLLSIVLGTDIRSLLDFHLTSFDIYKIQNYNLHG